MGIVEFVLTSLVKNLLFSYLIFLFFVSRLIVDIFLKFSPKHLNFLVDDVDSDRELLTLSAFRILLTNPSFPLRIDYSFFKKWILLFFIQLEFRLLVFHYLLWSSRWLLAFTKLIKCLLWAWVFSRIPNLSFEFFKFQIFVCILRIEYYHQRKNEINTILIKILNKNIIKQSPLLKSSWEMA